MLTNRWAMDISSTNTGWGHCLLRIAGGGSYPYAMPDVQVRIEYLLHVDVAIMQHRRRTDVETMVYVRC